MNPTKESFPTMSERTPDAFTRRDFLRTGLSAGALLPVTGLVLRAPAAFEWTAYTRAS